MARPLNSISHNFMSNPEVNPVGDPGVNTEHFTPADTMLSRSREVESEVWEQELICCQY